MNEEILLGESMPSLAGRPGGGTVNGNGNHNLQNILTVLCGQLPCWLQQVHDLTLFDYRHVWGSLAGGLCQI